MRSGLVSAMLATLAKTHQVDSFGVSTVSCDSLVDKCDQRFATGLGLFRIDNRSLWREVDLEPGIALWSQGVWRTSADKM